MEPIKKFRQSIHSLAAKAKDWLLSIFQPSFLRWLGRFIGYAVGFTLAFILFFSTLKYTWPYLIALLVAWALQPVLRGLTRRLRWKRNAAAMFMMVLVVLVFAAIMTLIVWRLVVEIISLIEYLGQVNFVQLFEDIQRFVLELRLPFTGETPLMDFVNQYRSQIESALASLSVRVSQGMASVGRSLLSGAASIPTNVMCVVVMFFAIYYFGRDWENGSGWNRIFQRRTIDQGRRFYRESVRIAGNYLSAYVKLIMVTFGETVLIFLILRVPYALLFAVLAAVLDLMPVIGVSIVYIPMMVFFAFQGAWFQVLGLIIGLVAVTLVRQMLEPKLVSKSIDVHPLLMMGIFLLALQLGSFWVMIFLILFTIAYKILVTVGIFGKDTDVDGSAAAEEGAAEAMEGAKTPED